MAHRPNHRRDEDRGFIARRWEHRSEFEGVGTPRRVLSESNRIIRERNGGVRHQFEDDIGGCSANYR